jgi:hypothetical protein
MWAIFWKKIFFFPLADLTAIIFVNKCGLPPMKNLRDWKFHDPGLEMSAV